MICSTSCFSRARIAWKLVALLLLSGCALSAAKTDPPVSNEERPTVAAGDLIAIFPVDNLTGDRAPVDIVGGLLRTKLEERGLRLIDDETIEEFMREHRVRDTGGVDSRVSDGLKEQTGASALLLTSLELFQDQGSPRVAMFSRLVSTGARPQIVWMDGVGMAGDEFPGLLAIGRIDDPHLLLEMAVTCIADSMVQALPAAAEPGATAARSDLPDCGPRGDVVLSSKDARAKRRHRPSMSFRSPAIEPNRRYKVAVIPFLNLSDRRNAGRILALHFVNQLSRSEFLTVVEPGIVREELLEHRIIMEAGPSLENAEVLSSDESLGADLVFSGSVFDYQDAVGVPKGDFSVTLIEKGSLRVVASFHSQNTGEDGVLFFGQGGIHTAHRLAAEMAKATIGMLQQ